MDGIYRSEALRVMPPQPARYLLLSAARGVMLWLNWTVQEGHGLPWTLLDSIVALQQAVLLIGAIIGLWRRWRTTWPLVIGILAVTGIYMAVIGRLYLLVPIMPLTIVLAAMGYGRIGQWLLARWQGRAYSLARESAT
ncbi:MAG: hypothetical protein IVW57_19505 [Ktedonobacterales bacterium]|nr:hypothetical protein [Ktedonobacterales bacterium]